MKTSLVLSTLFYSCLVATATPNNIVVDRLVSRHYSEERQLVRRGSGFANGGSLSSTGKDTVGDLNNKRNFEISFYHINDVHAHLDEFKASGSSCPDPTRGCVGGYPRVKSIVETQRPKKKHSLFLNAGDEFQGTLFYTLYKGSAISSILNQLGFDAMTLGNHEFDDGDDLLAGFLSNLTFPIISANIKTTNKKLARNLVPYKVFNSGQYRGFDLAIVAVTTETTKSISRPGEGTTFEDPVAAVKRTVKEIKRRHPGIKRIVALTHIGYENDIRLAKESTGISLIVGGHSHTLLADNTTVPAAKGPYPTIVDNAEGEEVFVVTSFKWGQYLGYIDLEYDSRGRIVRYEGAPILLNSTDSATKSENAALKAEVKEWAKGFEVYGRQVVGFTELPLDQTACQKGECTLGDLSGDALAGLAPSNTTSPLHNSTTATTLPEGTIFAGAALNAGGIRSSMDGPGNITLQQSLEVFPFGNTLVELQFTSTQLWNAFESIVSVSNVENPSTPVTSFVQVSSSIRFVYNPAAAVGSRLVSLTVGDGQAVVKGEDKKYILATTDYLASGGDGFWPARSAAEYVTLDTLDAVLVNYLKALGTLQGRSDGATVKIELDGRIGTSS